MKRIWLVVLLLLPWLVGAQGSNNAAGNLTAASASCLATNCVSLRYQPNTIYATITLSGTWSATVQFEVSGDYGVTWVAAPGTTSSTSNGTTQFTVGGYTMMRARVSAFVSGTVSVTIIGSTQSVSTGGGGSSGSGGAAGSLTDSTIYVNSSCATGTTNCFAATPGQAFFDCTYASASPTVTCGANDTLTTAMIGWRIMLTCCGAAGSQGHIGSALQTTAGTTITNINNSTHVITMSGNATATEATTGLGQSIVMGPLADTAFTAASTASLGSGGHCSPMNIGAGIYMVSQGFANTSTCKNAITGPVTTGWGVTGAGTSGRSGTLIVPTDNFSFASCTGQNSSCFFGVPGAVISNIAIWGGENSTSVNSSTCGTNAKNIIDLVTDSFAYNILLAGWCANDTALVGLKMDNPGEYCLYCIIDGAGGIDLDILGGSYFSHGFAGDSLGAATNSTVACVAIEGPSLTQMVASGFGKCGTGGSYDMVVAGTLWEDLDRYLDNASFNNPYVAITATGIVHSSGLQSILLTPGNTSDVTYSMLAAGAQLFIRDGQIAGGSANTYINCGGFAAFVTDEGGNTFTGAPTNCTSANWFQSNSITGTALATSNIGLTSGWSTSSVATATGDSHVGRFTITGAAGSANPTLTLTFPKAYIIAPASCILSMTGANDATDFTKVIAGTPSTTSVLFTFTGTSTAVTLQFDYQCGP